MKYKIILLFLFRVSLFFGQAATSSDSESIRAIRLLRDNISTNPKFENLNIADSLIVSLSKALYIAKSIKSDSQSKTIANYFQMLIANTDNPEMKTVEEIEGTLRRIYKDLELKLLQSDESLYLQGFSSFGSEKEIIINAIINDDPKDCCYRMYYANFTGRPYKDLIKVSNGKSSDNFANPYKIKIMVPAYIAFWLVDAKANTQYKSDYEYHKLDADTAKLSILFTKM